jgi:hypothetical protein
MKKMEIIIAITEQDVQDIINELEHLDEDNPATSEAVENWFRRTIREMIATPAHYAGGPMSHMNTSVPEFRTQLRCEYFGWAQCQNAPMPHDIYCEEHRKEINEG